MLLSRDVNFFLVKTSGAENAEQNGSEWLETGIPNTETEIPRISVPEVREKIRPSFV